MGKIKSVLDNNICVGCGLCEALFENNCKMKISDQGFYLPQFKRPLSIDEDKLISKICPSINIEPNKLSNQVWGDSIISGEAWSTDEEIRYKGSSGGFISGIAAYLLGKGIVDGVLHVGPEDDSWLYNKLGISASKGDIVRKAGSRYAPVKMFSDILSYLKGPSNKLLFIGKPCDIYALNNLLDEFPEFKSKIVLTISFFCAGIPSYNATLNLVKNSSEHVKPKYLRYRGHGWPGEFYVKYENEEELKLSYSESWGHHLGRDLNFRCKICPDGIGLNADISVGDSWESENGYPSFNDSQGRSIVIGRTTIAESIINQAINDKAIIFHENTISFKALQGIQKYQYERRIYALYRFLAFSCKAPFLLNYRNLALFKMATKGNIKRGIGNFIGTLKRM